jgi:hypothetical protein
MDDHALTRHGGGKQLLPRGLGGSKRAEARETYRARRVPLAPPKAGGARSRGQR